MGLKRTDMEKYATQDQILEINDKLDTLIEYVNQQRLKSTMVEDLVSDMSIITKDIYDSTVAELDNQMVDIEPGELRVLLVKLAKNVNNIRQLLDTVESIFDLLKDAGPLINEMIIDASGKLNTLEQKGYFEFFSESGKIIDNIVTHYSKEDVRMLADNIVLVLDTLQNLTQPEMLRAMNNAVSIFEKVETKQIPEYSLWKVWRERNSPEIKKGLGFIMTFLKNMAEKQNNK